MDDSIFIKTTCYSLVIRAIVDAYKEDATIHFGEGEYRGSEIDTFMEWWCTNKSIIATGDFGISRDGARLFGFHYHPSGMWAAAGLGTGCVLVLGLALVAMVMIF